MAREGLPFILACGIAALLFFVAGWWVAAFLFLAGGSAFAFFFRDPERKIPEGEHLLVSPADGRVVKIEDGASHPLLPFPATRVSIFLSLLDVHITRAPLSAEVSKMEYHPGRFLPAYKEEASSKNESRSLFLKGDNADVFLRQIVGVAARRIKCYVRERDRVMKGQRMGLMYFGSRVEVFFPLSVRVRASLGQKVRAGETVLGEVAE